MLPSHIPSWWCWESLFHFGARCPFLSLRTGAADPMCAGILLSLGTALCMDWSVVSFPTLAFLFDLALQCISDSSLIGFHTKHRHCKLLIGHFETPAQEMSSPPFFSPYTCTYHVAHAVCSLITILEVGESCSHPGTGFSADLFGLIFEIALKQSVFSFLL